MRDPRASLALQARMLLCSLVYATLGTETEDAEEDRYR
jgi:hypothetical protein